MRYETEIQKGKKGIIKKLAKTLALEPKVREWLSIKGSDPASWYTVNSDGRKISPTQTQRNYLRGFAEFLNYVDLDSEMLAADIVERMKSSDMKTRWFWVAKVKEWYVSLFSGREMPKPNHDDWNKLTSARSFFTFHYYKFDRGAIQRVGGFPEPSRVTADHDLRLSEVEEMKRVANPKERYVLVMGVSLGQRAEDFVGIKRKDVERVMRVGTAPYGPLRIPTRKRNVLAEGFITEEAKQAALDWLKTRRDSNPYMLPNNHEGHMLAESVSAIIHRLAHKAKIPYDDVTDRIRFHILRKFLQGRLEDSGANRNIIDQIIGHKLDRTQKPYSSKALRTAFEKAMPLLETQAISIGHKRVGKLEQDLTDAQKRLGEQELEILKMRKHMENVEDKIEDLGKQVSKVIKVLERKATS